MSPSFNASQIYGRTLQQFPKPTPADIVEASSPLDTSKANPLYYWLAFVALLVVARVLYDMAE